MNQAWAPPTPPTPPTPRSRNQTWAIVVGVVALIAVGVFAVMKLQGDDKSATPAVETTSTTVAATTTTTAPATTTTSPTTVPTTVAPVIDAATLIAAMPTDGEVPGDWSRYAEPHPESDTTGLGACSGISDHARAVQSGEVVIADGPRWDLVNDSWFGFDIYYFTSESAAQAFLAATATQANSCTTTPVTFQLSEGDWGMADDWMAEDTMWQMTEIAIANEESLPDADQYLRVLAEQHGVVTYDGITYGAATGYIDRFERHGSVVIDFFLGGVWDEGGWDTFTGAYQPTDSDLAAAVEVVQDGIVARLAEAGAI